MSVVLIDGEPVEIPDRLADEIRRLQAFEQRTIQAEADRQELLHGGGEGLLAWAAAQNRIARVILTAEAELQAAWTQEASDINREYNGRAVIEGEAAAQAWRRERLCG